MNEDHLEQEAFGWLAEAACSHLYGPDIAPDDGNRERADDRQVVLVFRPRAANRCH